MARGYRRSEAADDRPAPKSGSGGTGPTRWWQFVLIYPALAISVITAAPEWASKIGALVSHVDNRDLVEAKQQRALYAKNLDCTTAPFDWFLNPDRVNVDATICESGDIYVRASSPNNPGAQYFVPVQRVLGDPEPAGAVTKASAAAPSLAEPGRARTPGLMRAVWTGTSRNLLELAQIKVVPRAPSVVSTSVVCTKFIDNRRVLRHLRTQQACFDEVVDSFTGRTQSRTQVACRTTC